jgi:hypothetical protein
MKWDLTPCYLLITEASSSSAYTASNDWMVRRLLNTENENMRKEAVVAQFMVLYWNLKGGHEENHKIPVKTGDVSAGRASRMQLRTVTT